MAKLIINNGTSANDGTGDPLRNAATKINANFDEIYNSIGNGTAILFSIDFSSTQPSSGDSLIFNSGTNKFEPSSIVTELDDLSDVNLQSLSNGDILRYNTNTGAFQPSVLNLSQLDDVDTQGVTDGQVLKFNEASGKFEPAADLTGGGSGGGIALTDLSVNVLSSGTANLAYNNSTGVFSYTPPDLSDYALQANVPDSLLDLDIVDGVNGQVLSTDGSGNFSFISFPDAQNTITTVSGDTGSFTASEPNSSVVIEGGTDISTTVTGNTVSIAFTGTGGSGGAANFNELTDVSNADIDVSSIFESAIATLRVNNSGASAYTFNSHYSGDNPTIFALSGTTIEFDLSEIGGHPFEIRDPGGDPISDGLVHVDTEGNVTVGAGAQGQQSGTLYWRINESLSGNYEYICQFHGAMNGTITVKRFSTL